MNLGTYCFTLCCWLEHELKQTAGILRRNGTLLDTRAFFAVGVVEVKGYIVYRYYFSVTIFEVYGKGYRLKREEKNV